MLQKNTWRVDGEVNELSGELGSCHFQRYTLLGNENTHTLDYCVSTSNPKL